MKLVTFLALDGAAHIGALTEDTRHVLDFTALAPAAAWSRGMLELIDGGAAALDAARELLARRAAHALPLDGMRLLAPLPEPRQMRDFLSFERHIRQARANRHLLGLGGPTDPRQVELPEVWFRQPIYYKCNRFSVVGTEADVHWPRYSTVMDYELEFACVLGRDGKNIAPGDARAHVFGYTIFNDFSARDAQLAEMTGGLGPAKGKDFDTGNALGPWLVTADEIPDPYALTMVARVNGEEWSRGTSADMKFRFEDFLVHVSTDERVRAGEVFGSGTVGSGCGLEFGRFLRHGDVVELEVDGLGVLRNRVLAHGQPAHGAQAF